MKGSLKELFWRTPHILPHTPAKRCKRRHKISPSPNPYLRDHRLASLNIGPRFLGNEGDNGGESWILIWDLCEGVMCTAAAIGY